MNTDMWATSLPCDLLLILDIFRRLKVWDKMLSKSLCLCNILAGSCSFLCVAAVDKFLDHCSYILATAYDNHPRLPDVDGAGSSAVRILAVRGEENWVTYQILSTTSGAWGPVKRSVKLIEEDLAKMCVLSEPRHTVICGGSVVYWLVMMLFATDEEGDDRTCLFGMDTRTERTWTTELPEEYIHMGSPWDQLILATSEDGRRLSLVASKSQAARHQLEVWVLVGDCRWTLQRTMDIQIQLIPYLPSREQIWLRCFCPRSGYLLVIAMDYSGFRQQFLLGVDGSPSRQIGTVGNSEICFMLQYEMDLSTYISKM